MNDKQLEVIQTVVAMFKAAPGARYLSEFIAFIDNTAGSVKDLANTLWRKRKYLSKRFIRTRSPVMNFPAGSWKIRSIPW